MTRSKSSSSGRKNCVVCGRSKLSEHFYKTNSTLLFPDGRLNMCSDCVKQEIDFTNISIANDFLRQMDMPFISDVWEASLKNDKDKIIPSYLRIMHGMKYRDMRYKDSNSITSAIETKTIKDDAGKSIYIDEELMTKWGTQYSYTTEDYLKLEKFYRNMRYAYDISTPAHEEMLIDLARLNIEKEKLLAERQYNDYKNISAVFNNTLKDAGFRPIDRKSSLDEAGITSFGQIVQQVEKEGFIPPKLVEYEKDDIDAMLLYYIQWVQRFTDRQVSIEVDPDWRDQVDLDSDTITVDEAENIADAERSYAEEAIKSIENEIGISSDENE